MVKTKKNTILNNFNQNELDNNLIHFGILLANINSLSHNAVKNNQFCDSIPILIVVF